MAEGKALTELRERQCRFPVRSDGPAHFFCAAPIASEVWQPGKVNGCYCAKHRSVATAPAPSMLSAERAA